MEYFLLHYKTVSLAYILNTSILKEFAVNICSIHKLWQRPHFNFELCTQTFCIYIIRQQYRESLFKAVSALYFQRA